MSSETIMTRHGRARLASRALAASLAIAAVPALSLLPAQEAASTTGSGSKYRTVVERDTEGELSKEDFRQASMLASQLVMHVNDAVRELEDDQRDRARTDLEKARTLVRVLRELLPVTTVTTVVENADGEEVYRHVSRVQDDQIPIYDGMIAVEVIEPVADAKKEQAALEGVRLAGADLVHTSVLVDLALVERKLRRTLRLLDEAETEEAIAELAVARTEGVRFATRKRDDPLVEAQMALRLAERMAEEDRTEAAKLNLRVANANLELYRALAGASRRAEARELGEAVQELESGIEEREDAASEIRALWQRVAGLFQSEAGQTRPTTQGGEAGEARTAEAVAEPSGADK